jgi:hypothetical protein
MGHYRTADGSSEILQQVTVDIPEINDDGKITVRPSVPYTVEELAEIADAERKEEEKLLHQLEGKEENVDLFSNLIQKRIEHNKNYMACIVGQTGSGKSLAAIRMAQVVDPTFNIHRVCFTVKEFINVIKDPNLPSGSAIVFDEISVAHSNRNWFTAQNKILNAIHQIFRYRNLIVFYTCPDFSFIDSQTRKLFHMMISTFKIDYEKKVCMLNPYMISVSKIHGKAYYPYPRFHSPEGTVRLKWLVVGLPSRKMLIDYEEKKKQYGQGLLDSADRMINKLEPEEDAFKYRKPLTDEEQKVYNLKKEGLAHIEIATMLNYPNSIKINEMVQKIKKKGWDDIIAKRPKQVGLDPMDDPEVLV